MKSASSNSPVAGRMCLLLCALFVLPVVYVLSLGPAVRLIRARVLPEEAFCIWEPLRPLCDPRQPLGRALIRYQSWWLGVKYEEPPDLHNYSGSR